MATIISIVSYPFLPARTGGEKGVAFFYKYFSRWHRVICVTTQRNEPAAAEGYTVSNILSNSPLRYINPFYIFRLRRLIRQHQATHVILEHPYYGWLGVALKWICGVKLVVHSHNLEGDRWKSLGKWWWRILWSYEKWTHRQADYNFFIQDEDKAYAIGRWSLDPGRCLTMRYGFERETIPAAAEIAASRERVRKQHGIAPEAIILLFNGTFNYAPNLHALEHILTDINPLLQAKKDWRYQIIICGKDIPAALTGGTYPNVHFAGFVPDIDDYFRGADVFINPVVEGGGIKTKLVEALGNNLTAVSVRNGAVGIDPAWCNGKLLVCENGDWEAFAGLVVKAGMLKADTPPVYFDHFYWGGSTRKAAEFIQDQGSGDL